jgi:hypothetical protein
MKRAIAAIVGGTVVFVLGVVVLISAGTGNASDCGAASGGPSNVAGIPQQDLAYFEGAAQQFGLGSNGWAYLAALNYDESDFDTSKLPGVHSGTNSAGAAGPMQIGVGGAATDNWDTVAGSIPTGLSGAATPPSVYNEVDAVYGGAALLTKWGAPGNWLKALESWNDYAPEINTVEALVAEWTGQSAGTNSDGTRTDTDTTGTVTTTPTPAARMGAGTCVAVSGPSVPGAASKVEKDGFAAIPAQAPPAVQAMLAAGNELIDYPYSWGGGHSVASMTIPPGANADPGEEENGGPGYDCSSTTSFDLWGGGLGESLLHGRVLTSGEFAGVGQPGQGQWVTIYYGESGGEGHVFIEVDGVVLDTVHSGPTFPAGTGPRWQPLSDVAFELQTGSFTAIHPAGM